MPVRYEDRSRRTDLCHVSVVSFIANCAAYVGGKTRYYSTSKFIKGESSEEKIRPKPS